MNLTANTGELKVSIQKKTAHLDCNIGHTAYLDREIAKRQIRLQQEAACLLSFLPVIYLDKLCIPCSNPDTLFWFVSRLLSHDSVKS